MRSLPLSTWSFLPSDDPEAWRKDAADADWRTVRVPHDWSIEHDFSTAHSSGTGYLPGGVGWYRTHTSVRTLGLRAGDQVRLVFEGVYKNSDVWVNGYHLGSRPSGYAEFWFDLTEIVSYAADDDLAISVRVEHTDLSDSRWYNGTGITRKVRLEVHGPICLTAYPTAFSTLAADGASATIRIAQTVVNTTPGPVTVTIANELRSLAPAVSRYCFSRQVSLAPGEVAESVTTEQLDQPLLWSDEDPQLYRLVTTLTHSGSSADAPNDYQEIVGIRVPAFDPDHGFSINGEVRKLKGACLHEDAGCLGTAVPAEVWLRRLVKLKDAGCNAVRMAHNPHASELYTLCDLLGLFVIDEAFDEWENAKNKWWRGHNVYPPRHDGYARDFPTWHRQDLVSMVEAHRNHPSIIAWSIGNEIDYPNDPYGSPLFAEMTGNNDAHKPEAERSYDPSRPDVRRLTTIANRLIDVVRQADPSRPVTLAAAFPELSSLTGLFDRLDVVGYNYKEHLYAEHHASAPDRVFVGSENSHTYPNWLAAADNEFIAGQFLWTGIDFLGETHGWPRHGSEAGLLTTAGFEKPLYELRRSWWSAEPVARLVTRPLPIDRTSADLWHHPVSRGWEYPEGQQVEVLCFSNCDQLSLRCGDIELALDHDAEGGYWSAIVTARTEPLELTASRDGVEVTDRLTPRRSPARIMATPWQPPGLPQLVSEVVPGSGDQVLQLECSLADEDGDPAVGDAAIRVEVDSGTLLGIENGDQADNTPYSAPWRRTHDGRLVVYVLGSRATTVRLSSPGLADLVVTEAPGHEPQTLPIGV